MHDPSAGVEGLLVIQVDALAHELGLAGQVRVVSSRRCAGRHQRQPVLGCRGPTVVTTTWDRAAIAFNVDGCEASAVISGQDCAVSPRVSRTRQQLVLGTTRECDARVAARVRQVFGGQLSGETGRAVQDDVELTLGRSWIRRYPSVSGSSMSSPSTCWAETR